MWTTSYAVHATGYNCRPVLQIPVMRTRIIEPPTLRSEEEPLLRGSQTSLPMISAHLVSLTTALSDTSTVHQPRLWLCHTCSYVGCLAKDDLSSAPETYKYQRAGKAHAKLPGSLLAQGSMTQSCSPGSRNMWVHVTGSRAGRRSSRQQALDDEVAEVLRMKGPARKGRTRRMTVTPAMMNAIWAARRFTAGASGGQPQASPQFASAFTSSYDDGGMSSGSSNSIPSNSRTGRTLHTRREWEEMKRTRQVVQDMLQAQATIDHETEDLPWLSPEQRQVRSLSVFEIAVAIWAWTRKLSRNAIIHGQARLPPSDVRCLRPGQLSDDETKDVPWLSPEQRQVRTCIAI